MFGKSFSPADRLAAIGHSREDLYDFSRWMFLQRRGYQWQRAAHHRTVCDALMRVYRGECKRLIINVPPRYSKTELAVVNFIAWSLGKVPDAEFIHTSYSGTLAVNNSSSIKALAQHEAYLEIFPGLQLANDAQSHWKTTAGGVMYATGTGGTITGFGAGKHRPGFGGCFPFDQLVETEAGPKQIGEIVEANRPVRVWSFDENTKRKVLRHVLRVWRNPANHLIEVSSADGRRFRCTPDHEVLTRAGWVCAIHLAKSLNLVDRQTCLLGSSHARQASICRDLDDAFRMLWLCIPNSIRQALRDASPSLSEFNLADDASADAVSLGDIVHAFFALEDGRRLLLGELGTGPALKDGEGAVPESILHVVGLCAIGEIGRRIVGGVAVEVPNLISGRSWAYELLSDNMRDIAHDDLASHGQVDSSVALPVVRRLERSDGKCPANLAKVRNLVQADSPVDWTPDAVRYVGHVDETFCLEVEGDHNFILAQSGAIVSNCVLIDDPHKADEARSDVIRQGVIDWFQNTLESRKNSPETPIVVIMQRLHERDLSGWLLAGGNGEKWEHVCLPALRDDGTALWPEKHDVAELLRMQTAAPYTFAGQYQQKPAPAEGGIFKPGKLEVIEALPIGDIKWCRGWDFASTTDGDWTAGGKLGRLGDGRYVIADMARLRAGPDERDATIVNVSRADGRLVKISIPQDPGQAGKTQVKYMTRELAGLPVTSSPESGDKVTRAEPFAAQVNVGNVMMLKAEWNDALRSELAMFPNGTHDDQVDALSRAFSELIAPRRSYFG